MDLDLFQREAAAQVGVDSFTLMNWEKGKCTPETRHMPAVIAFLGYDPLPKPTTLSERLWAVRQHLGMSQRELASKLGVDPSTVSGWETQGQRPTAALRERLEQLFDEFLHSTPSS